MMWPSLPLLVALAVCVTADHEEELFIRPLPHVNKVLAHFHFATDETNTEMQRDSLYPAMLRQILTKYDASSLHLSFSVGQYSEVRHGVPGPRVGESGEHFHAPFGARLQVEFLGDEASIADRWKGVTSELGGLFSASLNQMDETTIAQVLEASSAAEFGAYDANKAAAHAHFMQSSLAREELCTENLTPWLKMLPCRAHAGLGSLIDPIKILSGEFAMLSVFASRDGATSGSWRFHQHLTTVQPVGEDQPTAASPWSLGSLFIDSPASTSSPNTIIACPLARKSVITTETAPVLFSTTDLKSSPHGISTTTTWLADLLKALDVDTKWPENLASVHRFQTGHGQVHGGLAVRLENRHATCSTLVTYNDVAPWYLRVYFHTFKTRLVSLDGGQVGDHLTTPVVFDFTPAELRGRPNQFRVQVELPPRSALVLSVQFEKVFVRLSEHPPDANRGFDIPSGVATFTGSQECGGFSGPRVVYAEPLLVALPTPDFSMPYNVITLTSTVVAFFVGSMLNTLLRKAPRIKRMLAQDPGPVKQM